ncbi:MAG: hypothetical protein KC582_03995 [Candidatus Magasanikbacteria bacterium]|nr:hypothetical protein [Candidatus Magasanikbacteria bacterium]USN52854.1 MAG: hypothetical protein H6759_02195 [Candidatus Nomurabacteria bacterium]HPF95394.1 hypothetical protein [bacterium]
MAILDIKPQSSTEAEVVTPKKESLLLRIFVISIVALPIIIGLWAIASFYFASIFSVANSSPQEVQRMMTLIRVINMSLSLLGLAALGGVLFVPVIAAINELINLFTRKNK